MKLGFLVHLFFLFIVVSLVHQCETFQISTLEKERGLMYLTFTASDPDNSVDIRKVNFTDSRKTVFLVQGYLSFFVQRSKALKSLIFEHQKDVGKVIIVFWALVPKDHRYRNVANESVTEVADDISEKLAYILSQGNQTIEFVGHSLGAHIAGQTGRKLAEKKSMYIDTLYALDPAGPWFEENMEKAVKCTDAKKVVVVHTNTARFGLQGKVCEDDIYPHGGSTQPGCQNSIWENFCSHRAAWDYYINQFVHRKI